MSSLSPQVAAALSRIQDPELGFSIVDLGLVYSVVTEGTTAHVVMTLTSPMCPVQDQFRSQVIAALCQLPSVETVTVEFTFSPRWSPSMASSKVQEAFALLGIPLTRI